MSKYSPLSHEEKEAAPVSLPPEQDDASELVSPVPADAPPAPSIHLRLGNPSTVWEYRDATGGLLSKVYRFDPPGEGKQVIPLTLWREPSGELRWRWKGVPAPRPLYRLDALATNPDAPVIICEGEKSADAAAPIFPKSVVTTSPSGSQAAKKADWSFIAGRRVLIWPDADAPGSKYAREVAEILSGLGCEVCIIDAMALAALTPDGLKREPVTGWDAADAVEEWADLEALCKAASALAKPFAPQRTAKATLVTGEEAETAETYISCGKFTMDAKNGLVAEAKPGEPGWISQPFKVLGACRDPNGRAWGKWISWRDRDGREHFRHVSDGALQGDPATLCALLADEGLRFNREAQRKLIIYLTQVNPRGRVTLVSRTGWHNVNDLDVFVLPNETLGQGNAETVILDGAAIGPYEARGTLADWQAGVGVLAADHALAVLAISAALAGPLLHLAGQEGGGLNFYGPSSKGKTTILQAAASVWGQGASPGYVRTWRATANGLEGAAASATDTCLVLDELSVVEARDVASMVYGLSNGAGKARAARDGSLRVPKDWRVLVISSGEIPIATKLAEERGRRTRAGQLVRLLDIPADRGQGFGAFDSAGPAGDAATLSKAIKDAAVSAYGVAGPEFVHRLVSEKIDGEAVRVIVADFVETAMPVGADGQIYRAAQRLGLIAAAGELATEVGVTPWREGAARKAAAWALEQWIAGRGGTESEEIRQAIEQVRLVIELHGESRFEPIGGGEGDARPVNNRLGWRKGEGSEREWWIPPQVWKEEICAGLNPQFVAKALADRGLLRLPNGRGFQCKVNLGGDSRANVYVLTSGILDGGEDAT